MVTSPKYDVTKGNIKKSLIWQKLWRRYYNFNVNKDQLPLLVSTRIFAMKLLFSIIAHDIIEFNPALLVIVASHIRPRVMINASFTSMLRISVKDCDHRSQPDVWGSNDRQHRIKPLNWFTIKWKFNENEYMLLMKWKLVRGHLHAPWKGPYMTGVPSSHVLQYAYDEDTILREMYYIYSFLDTCTFIHNKNYDNMHGKI